MFKNHEWGRVKNLTRSMTLLSVNYDCLETGPKVTLKTQNRKHLRGTTCTHRDVQASSIARFVRTYFNLQVSFFLLLFHLLCTEIKIKQSLILEKKKNKIIYKKVGIFSRFSSGWCDTLLTSATRYYKLFLELVCFPANAIPELTAIGFSKCVHTDVRPSASTGQKSCQFFHTASPRSGPVSWKLIQPNAVQCSDM